MAGKKTYRNCAYRLTSPGLGKEVGASLGVMQSFYQGFFMAPTVVCGALKGAVFAANIYEKSGIRLFQMQARAVMILFRQLRLAVQME